MIRKIKKSKSKQPLTRIAVQELNKKMYGDEPKFEQGHVISSDGLARFLNYYSSVGTINIARKFYKDLLKKESRAEDIKLLNTVPNARINKTGAWLARLHTIGIVLPNNSIEMMNNHLNDTLSYSNPETVANFVGIQQRLREKSSKFIADVEGMIDDNKTDNVYQYLKDNNAYGFVVKSIIKKIQPRIDELNELLSKNPDKQLKEAYSHLNKQQIKGLLNQMQLIINDAIRYGIDIKTSSGKNTT